MLQRTEMAKYFYEKEYRIRINRKQPKRYHQKSKKSCRKNEIVRQKGKQTGMKRESEKNRTQKQIYRKNEYFNLYTNFFSMFTPPPATREKARVSFCESSKRSGRRGARFKTPEESAMKASSGSSYSHTVRDHDTNYNNVKSRLVLTIHTQKKYKGLKYNHLQRGRLDFYTYKTEVRATIMNPKVFDLKCSKINKIPIE